MITVYIYFPPLSASAGSMTIFCRDLCRAFVKRGHRVVLCAIEPPNITAYEIGVPERWRTRISRLNAVILALIVRRHLRANPSEQVAFLNVSQEFVLLARPERSLAIVHDTIQIDHPRSRIVRLLAKSWWWRCRQVEQVVSVSQATANDLARLGIQSRVIYNHFNAARFLSFHPSDVPAYDAIWCGTLARHKRFDLFVALAQACPAQRFAVVLPEHEARTAKVPANIAVLHSLDDDMLYSLMARAEMLVSSSEKEGYGRPPMEALMLGTRVLLSDVPVFREIYGATASFFTLEADALIAKFRALRIDPTLRKIDWPALLARQGCVDDYVDLVETLLPR
jgi:glycosyltransferase involved in cell wall biosynthesis